MDPDGRTEWTDGQTHGRRQNYIPPTSSGDNKRWERQVMKVDDESYIIAQANLSDEM